MSTYEKIATVVIGILVAILIVISYNEFKEPEHGAPGPNSDFDQSIGPDFIIGSFATVTAEQASGGPEENCGQLHSVLIGVLHDIKERLEHQKSYFGVEDPFEVNQPTLQLLCNKTVDITLEDSMGDQLLLHKIPFVRGIPPGGDPDDIGTEVHIDATVVPAGEPAPSQPTTYGDELIPDRYLDAATSSPS